MAKTMLKVLSGNVELPTGKLVYVDSPQWFELLSKPSTKSFSYEDGEESYTARKELVHGIDYWYAYKKIGGKLKKKYIGKNSDVTASQLLKISKEIDKPSKARKLPKPVCNPENEATRLLENKLWIAQTNHKNAQEDFERLREENTKLHTALCNSQKQQQTIEQWADKWREKAKGKEEQPRYKFLVQAIEELIAQLETK